jgi:DNA-binding response OmpR family regulator
MIKLSNALGTVILRKQVIMTKILLTEDDWEIRELVSEALKDEGFEVDEAENGRVCLYKLHNNSYDLLLLDIMMPQLDGLRTLKSLRETNKIPVIMLTAKDKDSDLALALELGADDYIKKPFSMVELVARVKANLRRGQIHSDEPARELTILDLRLIPERFAAERNGTEITLTLKEFRLLETLARYPDRIFTKEQLYRIVWEDEWLKDENVINVTISRLREKIELGDGPPKYIITVWGIGYRAGK